MASNETASAPQAHPHAIQRQHPDAFVRSLLDTNTDAVVEGARAHRAELLNPPRSPAEYLAALESHGMTTTAAALRRHAEDI